jgi:hypothetical protein
LTERAARHRHDSSRTTTSPDSDEGILSMTTQYVSLFSRAGLEYAIAGVLFGATAGLVSGGALIMTLRVVFAG